MFPAEELRLLSGSTVLRTSTNTKAYKLLDQNSTSTLAFTPVKCLQEGIIAVSAFGLQHKRIKNKSGGKKSSFSFLLWKLLIPWSPQLPLSFSELPPVWIHWFWTSDQKCIKCKKKIIFPYIVRVLYLGRSEFLRHLVEGADERFSAKTQIQGQAKHDFFLI